ncbi:MAG: hypothetical protein QOD30_2075 [Actinomycetota bacterium]|jgi:uncharacterized protein (TIGR03084 family)|nr:hypothetical protein [Actinomycetota bacterium]
MDLLEDLGAEHDALDGVLAHVTDWEQGTPADGWTIADCVAHLWHFDWRASVAATDPDRFTSELATEGELVATSHRDAHALGAGLRDAWRARAREMVGALASGDPAARVPWYGPPMSLSSFVTARLMETWAHGQDVVDALALPPIVSDRLRHVAFIGVRARPFSYVNRGRDVPDGDVRVELVGPGGDTWTFGDSTTDTVRGSALDFCLVVTQRRHRADTDLVIEGPLAEDWMAIAQAFAGPPTDGRAPLH